MEIKGLLLESKYPEYKLFVKGPLQKVWRDGFPVDEPSHLVLAFDRFICEIDQMAQDQEWSDGDIEAVGNTLERFLKDPMFRDVWIHEVPKPAKPWPTYDETPESQIALVAQATGMIDQALLYEQRGRETRDKIVKKLEELRSATEVAEDDLAAV